MDDNEKLAERLFYQHIMKCRHCGICCHPRVLIIEADDIQRIADFYSISFEKAKRKYSVPHPSEIGSRILKSHSFRCRFFNPATKRCKIYRARPYNCRVFPFLVPALRRVGEMFVKGCPAVLELTHWNALPSWPEEVMKEIDAYYNPLATSLDKKNIILKLITLTSEQKH